MTNKEFHQLSSVLPMFAFSGFSNSGKTTLMSKVIAYLTAKGIRVAAVKHDGHDFSVDVEGKDTWKHRDAGAEIVAITSKDKLAIMDYRAFTEEQQLRQTIQYIDNVDLILVEGFKRLPIPKIFVLRNEKHVEHIDELPMVEAIATDFPLEHLTMQVYDINDVESISQHIICKFFNHTMEF